jgi:hypothetical protein
MRQLLEEAVLTCWQEAQNLALVVAPAALLGPIFVIIAGSSLTLAVVTLPVVLLAYLVVYAASIRAASLIAHNLSPDPVEVYHDLLFKAPDVIRIAFPGWLLAAGVAFGVLVVASQGWALLAAAMALGGAGVIGFYFARHAYDLPLIIAHGLPYQQASRGGAQLADAGQQWTVAVLGVSAAPLAVIGLLCLGFSAVVSPVFGGVVFVLVLSAWLPLVAFVMTTSAEHLIDAASGTAPQAQRAPSAADQRPWN